MKSELLPSRGGFPGRKVGIIMMKVTQREIRALVLLGHAREIISDDMIPERYNVIAFSRGSSGVTGLLIHDLDTGRLLAVSSRNSFLRQISW